MTAPDHMALTVEEVIRVIRILEEVVVSLDRIFSRTLGGADAGPLLIDYFTDCEGFLKLSGARGIQAEAMDRELGRDEVTEYLQDIKYYLD